MQIIFLIYFLLDLFQIIIFPISYSINGNKLFKNYFGRQAKRLINWLLNSILAYLTRDYRPLTCLSKITRIPETISKQSKLIRADARWSRFLLADKSRRKRLEAWTCSEQIQARERGRVVSRGVTLSGEGEHYLPAK